jgi:hypothetical protein
LLPTDPRPLGRMFFGTYCWSPFFDGPATGIKGLQIKSKSRVLWSLRIEYDACGQSFQSVPHGEPPHDVKDLQEDEVSFTCVSQGFFGLFIWIWCMWPIISIHSPWSTSSFLWKQNWQRQSKLHILHFNGMTFLLLKLDLDLLCYMVDESYVMCILHVFTNSIEAD